MLEMQNTNDQSPRLRVVAEGQTVWLSNDHVIDLSHDQIAKVAQYCECANLLLEGLGDLLELGRKHAALGTAMAEFGRFMGGE
jgi:hypothetical protein